MSANSSTQERFLSWLLIMGRSSVDGEISRRAALFLIPVGWRSNEPSESLYHESFVIPTLQLAASLPKFLDWPGLPSMMAVGWVGQECFSREFGFHNAPAMRFRPRDLGLCVLDLPQALPGEKRGSRRERIAPLLPCSRTPARARALFRHVAGSGRLAGAGRMVAPGLRAGLPRASSRPEPVGAVDESDLLKAGGNDANWLMYGRTYNAHRYSPSIRSTPRTSLD